MKRIFTSAAILIALLNTSQLNAQCITNEGTCDNVIDDFSTNPSSKNYNLMGFIWSGPETAGQTLRIPSVAPLSQYHITTPAYYINTAGVVNVGFTISTWTGSNNYFAVGNFDLDIDVINAANNEVIANCSGNIISSAGKICFQISAPTVVGMMVKYRFMFESSDGVTGSRVINFDDLAVSSLQQAVLPVTFMSISGTKTTAGNKIAWTVGAETNVNRYEIEESGNGKTFTLIGSVPATTYYRVKSKDIDNTTRISPVITIKATTAKGGKGKIALGAYPTPTSGDLVISHDEADMNSALTIVSVDGRMVKSFVPTKGSIQTTVNMNTMQPGMYFVRYQAADGEIETIKVVKQ